MEYDLLWFTHTVIYSWSLLLLEGTTSYDVVVLYDLAEGSQQVISPTSPSSPSWNNFKYTPSTVYTVGNIESTVQYTATVRNFKVLLVMSQKYTLLEISRKYTVIKAFSWVVLLPVIQYLVSSKFTLLELSRKFFTSLQKNFITLS